MTRFLTFNTCVVVTEATGSLSSGSLSAFDVISGKTREIAGDDVVTVGTERSCP